MFGATIVEPPKPRVPITLVFTSAPTGYNRILRLFTQSPASHVALGIGEGRQTLIQADFDGVVISNRKEWFKRTHSYLVAEYEVLVDVTDGFEHVLREVGKPYDFIYSAQNLLSFFYRWTVGWTVRHLYRELRTSQTCAQLAMMLDPGCVKIKEWCGLDIATVNPGDLLSRADGPSFRRIQ